MINRSDIKAEAKQTLTGNWGIAIGAVVIYAIIMAGISSIIIGVGAIFYGLFYFGLIGIFMSLIRTKTAKIESLFSGFNNFGTTFVTGLLVELFTFLWSLLFIIPGIVKSYAYSMTFFILNDNPTMSATQAIDESKRITKGHKMELFILDLSFLGWFILSALTFGILLLYVQPYYTATKAAYYEKLKTLPVIE